ncbi:hypothetical protein [Planctopirus ephydatiae]|nr:hypothetical protein [Planctopirus ephydatiae]
MATTNDKKGYFMVFFLRLILAAVIIASVSEISGRWPRIGALLLSLPLTSILAFSFSWQAHGDLKSMSAMARETLILVPLTLPFFVPLAFAEQWHMGFWTAVAVGLLATSVMILGWFAISQNFN